MSNSGAILGWFVNVGTNYGSTKNIDNSTVYYLNTIRADSYGGTSAAKATIQGLASTLGSAWLNNESTGTNTWKYGNEGYPVLKWYVER